MNAQFFRMSLARVSVVLTVLLASATVAAAPPPVEIAYRGVIEDTNGPYTGDVGMLFKIYDVDIGGTPVWSEAHMVNAQAGRFSVTLGSGSGTPPLLPVLQQYPELYLAIEISGAELSGRQRLLAVPYARRADDGIPSTAVMFFDGPCPTGWSDYVPAQGRTVVGEPTPGTSESATVGSALADVTPPEHGHVHNHVATAAGAEKGPLIVTRWCPGSITCDLDSDVVFPGLDLNMDAGAFADAALVDSDSAALMHGSPHTHPLTVEATTATDGALVGSLPYVQLRACRKD